VADLTIDGTKIRFAQEQNKLDVHGEEENKKSWVDYNDAGDKDPEM
jgi:hypothetical protein